MVVLLLTGTNRFFVKVEVTVGLIFLIPRPNLVCETSSTIRCRIFPDREELIKRKRFLGNRINVDCDKGKLARFGFDVVIADNDYRQVLQRICKSCP